MKTRRWATPRRHFAAAPRSSSGRPVLRRRPSTTTRSSCSRQLASGPDDQLTIYEPSQSCLWADAPVWRSSSASIPPTMFAWSSRFIGGAFGSKGSVTPRTALVAIAAKRLNRPVKLVMTRDQGFTIATYRAETRHHMRLAAATRRQAARPTPRRLGSDLASRSVLWSAEPMTTTSHVCRARTFGPRSTSSTPIATRPGFMRSPPEVPYMYALESALDELAVELKMDPMELRRINDTMSDPISGAPYTSRSLMRCYDEAAAKFGWSHRNAAARLDARRRLADRMGLRHRRATRRSLRRRRRGCASPHEGAVKVEIAAQDIGTGAYTVAAQVAAEKLGVRIEDVTGRARRHQPAARAGRRRLGDDGERVLRRRQGLRRDRRQARRRARRQYVRRERPRRRSVREARRRRHRGIRGMAAGRRRSRVAR